MNLSARNMTKADLVENVTARIARTAGPTISKKDCARVVDAFLDAIKEALQEQKNIEVRGFGTFKIRQRKTRMARNPRTGSPVEVSARPVPVFKPSKELRAMVAGIEAHLLDDDGDDDLHDS
ncbi:MAG: HU family DNA-binding protein [Gemmatimonas sp.]|uniref:HU family DNA-binding protein n=2 Tax=Gemmatimonas sp. TaxID=1962908 RepID=UPI00391D1EE8